MMFRAVASVLLATVVGPLAVVLLLAPSPAAGHAIVTSTSPADRQTLESAPSEVVITFDEPVTAASDGVRVFDADATRVDTGAVDTGSDVEVAAGLPPDLPAGGYVAVYRVTSTDSHPIGGVLSFTVGGGATVDDAVVARLFGGDGAAFTAVLGGLLRGLAYAATLLAAGSIAVAWLLARSATTRERARRTTVAAAGVGLVVTVLSVPVQGVGVTGTGIAAAVDPRVLQDVLTSSFGLSAGVRIVALLLLTIVVLLPRLGHRVLPMLAGLAAAGSFTLDGHQRSVEPTWLLVGADAVHLWAAAFWFAGLVLVGSVVRRPPDDDVVAAARLVRRFSDGALAAVILVVVAGSAMSWPLVRTPSALVTTGYGWTLVAKLVLVAAVVGVAAYNRRRLVPALSAGLVPAGGSVDAPVSPRRDATSGWAWRHLRITLRIEAVILLAVLGVTAGLVTQRPAAESAGLSGLYEASAPLGDDLRADLVVDPNRAGLNSVHLYVVDETGRPSDAVDDLSIELTYLPERIGPIPLELFVAGPGHWTATGDELAFPGDWELRIVAGVDRFSEEEARIVVPVAPA